MKTHGHKTHVAPWEEVSRRVFWDRDVERETWRKRIEEAHPSYLHESVIRMTPREFIHYLGRDVFLRVWPTLRTSLTGEAKHSCGGMDLAWSWLVSGTFNVIPVARMDTLTKRERDFLFHIAKHPSETIYGAAKACGMQYRRAHEYAGRLQSFGFIRAKPVKENGRRKTRLYSF